MPCGPAESCDEIVWTRSSGATGYDAAAMSHREIADFQARRVRGDASARDCVESCLRGIAALNPQINAFVQVDVEGARAAARESDARMRDGAARGPLDGVALAVKDNIDVAGLPAAGGIGALKAHVPRHDATCIARLREQGALFLGKTLMDEAAYMNKRWNDFKVA